MHQYRLQGPYANPTVASEVYSRQPKGDFLECSITAAFLGASKVRRLIAVVCLILSHDRFCHNIIANVLLGIEVAVTPLTHTVQV